MIKSYISSYIAPILDDKRFTMILLARSRYMRHRLGLFFKSARYNDIISPVIRKQCKPAHIVCTISTPWGALANMTSLTYVQTLFRGKQSRHAP